MNDTISYKINNSYFLPYSIAIDKDKMREYEAKNEIIASSRIYLICQLKRTGFLFKKYSKPKVLYVGETFDKQNRFSPHEKLLKATTIISPNDKLVVYFLQMRFSFIGFPSWESNPLDLMTELKDLESKTSVRLLERLFIKLFDPELNDKHKKTVIYEDNLVKEKLISNSIRYVHLDIGMNDKHFQFFGGNCVNNQDWYTYDLQEEQLLVGLPDLIPK
jgi:hypothetical protein